MDASLLNALCFSHPTCLQAQQAAAASQRVANGEPGADEDSSSDEEGSEDEEDGDAMDAEVGRAGCCGPACCVCIMQGGRQLRADAIHVLLPLSLPLASAA